MSDLDETLRGHLGELARDEASPLGPVERGRILARVREEVSAGEHRAAWLWLAAAVGLLALAWAGRLLGGMAPGDDPLPPRALSKVPAGAVAPETPAPAEAPDPPERVEPIARACATRPIPEGRERRGGDVRALELGDRARFVLFGRAEARLERVSACETTLVLEDGRVAVHASDLAGGELVVRTPAGEVVVHGTVFDVRFSAGDSRLRVAVAEGEVGVVAGGEEISRLRGGHALDLTEGRLRLSPIGEAQVESLLETVRRPIRPRVSRPRTPPEPERPPPRGEVVGGVPLVHQPGWSTDDD